MRIAQLILSLALGIIVSWQTYGLYASFPQQQDWLYWDPAAHAWYGIRMAEAVRQLEPLVFLKTLNEQTLWPPLHSLLQIPFQFLFGPSFQAASFCSLAFLALIFPALTFLYHQLGGKWPGWAALMALAASSPYYAAFGSMAMLEIFGAVFTAVSAALYLRKSRWFPPSLALLFFLKYNYCLYVLIPVLLLEGLDLKKREGLPKMSPFGWFVAACLLLIAIILLTGGFKVGGLSIQGIGNPLYVLLLIVLARAAIQRQYGAIWKRIRGTGWEWLIVPVVIWLVIPIPNRIRTFVNFAVNEPLGGHHPAQLSYYTFYLESLSVYFSTFWLPWICGAGALIAAGFLRHRRDVLFLSLLFVLPLLLMTVNQNKQARFLFTYVFVIWILCAIAIDVLPKAAVKWAAAAALCCACLVFYDASLTRSYVAWQFVPAIVKAPIRFIARQAAGEKEVRILGTSNEISPALLTYHLWQSNRRLPGLNWNLEKDPPANTLVIAINGDAPGTFLQSRVFPSGYRVAMSSWPVPQ